MRLRCLLVADPVQSVSRRIADGCERLADERIVVTSGERALAVASSARPEMVVLSLELTTPGADDVAAELRRRLPETFVVVTYRELAVPTMERVSKLGIDELLPQPLDLTAVYRAASRRFNVPFRRHERRSLAVDVTRADGVLVGRTLDVSEGGLRFTTVQPLGVEDSVLVDVAISEKPLRVRFRVLEIQGRAPLPVTVRAQFENLRGRELERLSRFLATLAREPEPS